MPPVTDTQKFEITRLGTCRIESPMAGVRFVEDDERVLLHGSLADVQAAFEAG
jgi:hypothetical protein